MNLHNVKSYIAEAAVNPFRIVKMGATDGAVLQAAAVGDKSIGVTDNVGGLTVGGRMDVIHGGIAEVEAGGAITRGDPITSDAVGKGLTAAPGAGTNNYVIGRALKSAVLGDIVDVLLYPSVLQG